MTQRTILITGVSSGLGRALASEALAQGWHVVGKVREDSERREFEATREGRAFGRILDMRELAGVPGIVDEAIQVKAKAIWMQLGVIHNEAAAKARAAGMEVVMDRCILKEHRKMLARQGAQG